MMNNNKNVYWVDLNRFDLKPDKSTWLEMSDALNDQGYRVTILTGYGVEHFQSDTHNVTIKCFNSINQGWFFRVTLLINILIWLIKHTGNQGIVILHPSSLFMAPFLRIQGRTNIHLDVRTVPVEIHTLKDRVDKLIYWTLPMVLLAKLAKSHSFITEPLRYLVSNRFELNSIPHVIWESGVNTRLFTPHLQTPDKHFTLLYHGTITENRGLSSVVSAIAKLDQQYPDIFKFVIIGDGVGLGSIREEVERQNIRHCIDIKGMLPYESIADEIKVVDCCICPLPNRIEWNISSPLKVFEYMATAKPMILTPIPAHKNVLDNQEYVVWTKGEAINDFVEAIKFAYIQRSRLQRAALKAPGFVRSRYDWICQGEKLAGFFNTVFDLKINDVSESELSKTM